MMFGATGFITRRVMATYVNAFRFVPGWIKKRDEKHHRKQPDHLLALRSSLRDGRWCISTDQQNSNEITVSAKVWPIYTVWATSGWL